MGRLAILKKNGGPIMSNFWGWFFHVLGLENIVVSALKDTSLRDFYIMTLGGPSSQNGGSVPRIYQHTAPLKGSPTLEFIKSRGSASTLDLINQSSPLDFNK